MVSALTLATFPEGEYLVDVGFASTKVIIPSFLYENKTSFYTFFTF